MATTGRAWVGIDIGKTHHWVCVLDTEGTVLLSSKLANDESEIIALIATVTELAEHLVWAVDIIGAPSALILALLARAGQSVRYASGRVVAAMSAAYVGEGKTDAKDAYVIAEIARIRRDLAVIDRDSDLVRNLAVLTGHRADLIADRVRMINRLRDLMTSVFPSLEREFDYKSCKGAVVLLTGYASPERIRRIGQTRLAAWLRHRRVRDYDALAARAIAAARAQLIALPGQELAAAIISELATNILALDERVKALDVQIATTFDQHPQAAIITSMPGFGPILGASLLVGAGNLAAFPSAGHLAAVAGLVPVPNDSGRHQPISQPLTTICRTVPASRRGTSRAAASSGPSGCARGGQVGVRHSLIPTPSAAKFRQIGPLPVAGAGRSCPSVATRRTASPARCTLGRADLARHGEQLRWRHSLCRGGAAGRRLLVEDGLGLDVDRDLVADTYAAALNGGVAGWCAPESPDSPGRFITSKSLPLITVVALNPARMPPYGSGPMPPSSTVRVMGRVTPRMVSSPSRRKFSPSGRTPVKRKVISGFGLNVEEVAAAQMPVPLVVAGRDRGQVDLRLDLRLERVRIIPIDPATGKPGPKINIDDVYNMYFTPDGMYAIAVQEQYTRLAFYDPHTWKLHDTLSIPSCRGIDHVDFTADGTQMLASCEFANRMVVVNFATHQLTATIDLHQVPNGKPQDVKLSPDGSVFYVADMIANGIYTIDAATFQVTGFQPTGKAAHGLYVARDSRRLFITNRGEGSVSVFDLATRQITAKWVIPGGGSPDMGNISADGTVLWLTGRSNSVVYAISTVDGHLIAKIPVGAGPHGLTVWPLPGRYSLGHTGILR
jgi:transposase